LDLTVRRSSLRDPITDIGEGTESAISDQLTYFSIDDRVRDLRSGTWMGHTRSPYKSNFETYFCSIITGRVLVKKCPTPE
jgi:hypothetical protein